MVTERRDAAMRSGMSGVTYPKSTPRRAPSGAQGSRSARLKPRKWITLTFDLENDPALIPAAIDRLRDAAERFQLFDAATAGRIEVALHEAMLNGMHHGNLELDSSLREGDERFYRTLASVRRQMPDYQRRRLHVGAWFSSDAALFIIRDEGRGFDPDRVPLPTDPAGLEQASGRGLLLIRSFMDEVAFNSSGNQIAMYKRRDTRTCTSTPRDISGDLDL
jgi:anti-sigma regulatory factor (Ser/Thr protein kinase)